MSRPIPPAVQSLGERCLAAGFIFGVLFTLICGGAFVLGLWSRGL